jgi:hypothetical protein
MSVKEIVIDINETGDVRIEANGFVGPECEAMTKDLKEAIGVVEKVTQKPEYRQVRVGKRTQVR